MAAISNFTQAMRELTGFDEENNNNNKSENVGTSKASIEDDVIKRNDTPRMEVNRYDVNIPDFDDQNGSQVTKSMVIKGRIEGKTSMKIEGKVAGDINITSSMSIGGTVVGNIKADGIIVSGAVKGDLVSSGDIKIDQQAILVGDTNSQNIYIEGKVKGNIDNHYVTDVAGTAMISGDIVTDRLISDGGSFIGGSITTRETKKFDFDEDKLFNIGG